jgi:hypothetical protein
MLDKLKFKWLCYFKDEWYFLVYWVNQIQKNYEGVDFLLNN